MKKLTIFFSAIALIALSTFAVLNISPIAQAGSTNESQVIVSKETTTFAIKNMTCATCPITVRKAMEGVKGVNNVTVDFDRKTATAVYDSTIASVEQIGTASTNAGYPATPEK